MRKWLYIIFITLMMSGCNFNNNATEKQNANQNIVNVNNSTIQNVDRYTGQQISQRLVELATSIPKVNDATAVVLGRYAIVGIDVNEDLERSQVGSIKYSVAESLKADPHGANAMVIADPDLTARLKEIQQDIQNGDPIEGIANELADISGRLIPEIPADIVDPNTKTDGVDQPKQTLNKNDENKLHRGQEEQSEHRMK